MSTELLIDLYKAHDPYSGLGEFSRRFHEELVRRVDLPFHLSFMRPTGFEGSMQSGVTYRDITLLDRYLPGRRKAPRLWHSLYQNPSHPPHRKSLQIMTVHDLNFLTEKEGARQGRYLARLQRSVDRADVVVAISEQTKGNMEEHLELGGKEVEVIYNGVALDPYPEEPLPSFLSDRPYFLSLGVHSRKKNLHVLLPLLDHFPEHLLVLAGENRTTYGEYLRKEAIALGVADRVLFPGTITDARKYRLLTDCEAFLFPSVAEGFGLPVIESLLAGRPTFTSDRTSLPEIGGGETFLWREFDPESMASILQEGLRRYAKDPTRSSARYRAHGARFSWKRSIDAYLRLYAEVIG